jgi:peptidylprolyl isomerase
VDRRVVTLLVAAGLAVALVAGILIARSGGGSSDNGGSMATANRTKPKVEVPDGPPPRTLQTKDLIPGTGAVAKSGDTIKIQYVAVIYKTGKEFDSSWGRGPFSFQLGGGRVIPGWDQGIAGMRVGGRRELTIPPGLGYGAQGSPPVIPPNSTLIFVIDLLAVK